MNNNLFSSLNISKIAASLNKTLGIINKAIPIYEEMKPIFKSTSSIKSILDKLNKKDLNLSNSKQIKNVSNNSPTFFQ